MITPAVQAEIEKAIGARMQSLAPLSAANNAQIYKLLVEGNRVFVIKVAERDLDTEAFMLNYLREKSGIPVPRVFYSNEHVIIMEFIETFFGADDAAQVNAAEHLAKLHAVRSDKYGFPRDTLIGMLRQPNPETTDWRAFYAENRLLYMAREALRENKIDAKLMKQVEKLAGSLAKYIVKPNPPSLIHGDIWGGNVLFVRGRVAAFLDPAIYYADAEVELAFIKLFNTLGAPFFSRYNEINPIAPGFHEERADIYNVYPLLVHTRLFGISYARKAQRILDRFVG